MTETQIQEGLGAAVKAECRVEVVFIFVEAVSGRGVDSARFSEFSLIGGLLKTGIFPMPWNLFFFYMKRNTV